MGTFIAAAETQPVLPPVSFMHRLFSWLKWALLGLLIGVAVLGMIGIIYQRVATALDARAFPPPGKLVDVGGYRLHIHCTGQAPADSPTVILLDGLPSMSAVWANVQPTVAQATRVCSYDRAGGGWSDPGPNPRDAQQIATELHTLLAKADIAGPYVLVGQSFGGLYARMYADLYPGEVIGMVLVDASHPDMWDRFPAQITAALRPPIWQANLMRLAMHLGLLRLTSGNAANCGLPARQCAEFQAFNVAKRWDTWIEEMFAPNRDAQVRQTQSLGAMPLVVLTANDHSQDFAAQVSADFPEIEDQFEHTWQELQDELAMLSSNSLHRIIAGAGHASFQIDQKYVPATNTAILQVVEAARTGQPLKP
jgi:pimeloyl-ACP methyl ester carboxylesterase